MVETVLDEEGRWVSIVSFFETEQVHLDRYPERRHESAVKRMREAVEELLFRALPRTDPRTWNETLRLKIRTQSYDGGGHKLWVCLEVENIEAGGRE